MRAIDTNIVIRAVTADDPEQTERVRALLTGSELFVPITVMLEAEWVLRSSYRFDRARIVAALRTFLGLGSVHVQHATEVRRALDYAAGGMEFADALHLALSSNCADFVSFDGPLARSAAALGAMPVVEPAAVRKAADS